MSTVDPKYPEAPLPEWFLRPEPGEAEIERRASSWRAIFVAALIAAVVAAALTAAIVTKNGPNEEARLDELLAAYDAPGDSLRSQSPEIRDAVNRAWRTYQNAGPVFGPRLLADHSPSGYWLQQAVRARELYRKGNPLLDQYLAYQELSSGRGTKEDFFKSWRKR